jgi:hypothetical protein
MTKLTETEIFKKFDYFFPPVLKMKEKLLHPKTGLDPECVRVLPGVSIRNSMCIEQVGIPVKLDFYCDILGRKIS